MSDKDTEKEDKTHHHDKQHGPDHRPPGPPNDVPPGKHRAPNVPGNRPVGR